MFSKVIIAVFVFAGNSLAQSVTLSGFKETTMIIGTMTTVMSVPSGFPDLTGSVVSCPASTICEERVAFGEYSDSNCKFTQECMCVAYNTAGFASCLKEKCPGNWESFRDAKLKTCTGLLGVDLSGSKTHTGMTVPTNLASVNVTMPPDNPEGGLSVSDKIALGVGLGFGIPTVVIGVVTLVCMRRRKARAARELLDSAKNDAFT